ncbi:MAG TPA: dipeptidase [Bryobacterales bacterium]|nr:dipeptidase [Bryobacterales bacterium]
MRALIPLVLAAASAGAQTTVSARAQRLLDRAVVLDLHDDTTQMILDEGYNLGELHDYGQVDIPRMRRGRVSGIFLSIWTDSARYTPLQSIKRALDEIDADRREIARHPADLVLATSSDEIVAAKKQGRIAMLMGVEGGHMIDSDLAILHTYYALGARYLTLTHSTPTPWAGSSGGKSEPDGLNDFGRQVVRELNRIGMMVDVSHVSDKTFYDTLAVSRAPVIASHSSCRALGGAARDMTDDMLRALAKNGGVVHINFYNAFLDPDFAKRSSALKDLNAREEAINKEFAGDPARRAAEQRKIDAERLERLGRVPLSRLLDHFEHAVKVAGVDHVGLGSDFDGANDQFPEGMEDISKIPNLVQGLMERGFSDADIEKILGGNTLRVMREVERVARRTQKAN